VRQAIFPLLLIIALAGCSTQGGGAARLDAVAAAGQALAEYDPNKDGALDAKELERCPALRQSLKLIDKNGDGRISAEEIAERLRGYAAAAGNRFSFPCQVTLDSKPLAGAVVTAVPEKFLGAGYRKATGTTDEAGAVYLQEEGQQEVGLPSGLYRLEVSRKSAQGQETLPARYNSQTTLGLEVGPDTLGRGGDLPINLKSR
jgi:hypothetical protein